MFKQDWNVITWDKRYTKQQNQTKKEFIKQQLKNGGAETVKKIPFKEQLVSSAKIERLVDEGILKHQNIPRAISLKISKKRQEKCLTQVQLAQKINVGVNIIKDYENPNTKTIPNHNILNKIEKILGSVR